MPLMPKARRVSEEPEDSSEDEMLVTETVDTKIEEDEEMGDEDEGEENGEEFLVEVILDHKWEKGVLLYQVRWAGYPSKADWTWESEETLEENIKLDDYLKKIGGRPSQPNVKKGSRKSTGGATTPTSAKKGRGKQDSAEKEERWKPPSGSWEDEIRMIETLEKTENDLVCYIQWANGRKSQHPAHVVYKKCPQKMLQFYESHLVFKDSTGVMNAKSAAH